MKFYYIIISFATIFQTFSCVSMDRHSEEAPMGLKDPIVFPTPIPVELEEYFTNSDKKLTFPNESKQKIIDLCNKTQNVLHKKEALQSERQEISDLIELQKQRAQTLASIEKENDAMRQKCTELRSKTVELQNEIQQKKAGVENKRKDLQKLQQTIQQQKNYRKRELRFNLPPIQSLMQQFGVKNRKFLTYSLQNLCHELENGDRRNDVINGPYYKNILFGPINDNNSYTFDPLTAQLTIMKHPFSTLDISTDSSSEFSFSHSDEVENL